MNDMSDDRIWARKGETVTCIKGHPICDISRDLFYGEPRHASQFVNWRQPEPEITQSVSEIRCKECRGIWIRGNTRDGYQFHFAEGWR